MQNTTKLFPDQMRCKTYVTIVKFNGTIKSFENTNHSVVEFLILLVFYVTCNDISVIHVMAEMCRRTEKEVVPTVGLPTTFRRVL